MNQFSVSSGLGGTPRAIQVSMYLFNRLAHYHSESRPTFVLITEFVAFVGTMATMLGMSVLFSLFH